MRHRTQTHRPLPLLLLILAACAVWAVGVARAVEPVAVPRDHGKPRTVADPSGTAAPGTGPSGDKRQVQALDQQIKSTRDEFHSQLDPLQEQVKTLKDKYEPQIKALEDKRHDIVEAGKPQAIQDLDRQEASELVGLADKEKADIDRVRQQYADARRDLQAKYKQQREGLTGGRK